jgi:hypothetical protein
MEFYHNGGAMVLKIDLPNQPLSGENLLTNEKQDIIAIMKSLEANKFLFSQHFVLMKYDKRVPKQLQEIFFIFKNDPTEILTGTRFS